MNQVIIAAGAVVWRRNKSDEVEIAIIHRPKYDDWSFPKGKADISEEVIACAHREVLEESNLDTQFGPYLGDVEYMTSDGAKRVFFWSAKVINEYPFTPNSEVDKIEWVSIKEACHFLSYDEDREILDEFINRERYTSTLILLRHAKAVKRSEWNDYDLDRPLSPEGVEQGKRLVSQLVPFGIEGIFSSDATRCFATVEPLSQYLNLKVTVAAELNEESYEKDSKKALSYVRHLMRYPGNQLVAGHNPIIPEILTKLARVEYSAEDLDPADAWVVHHRGDMVHSVEFIRHPKVKLV